MNTLEGQQEGYKRPRNEHIRWDNKSGTSVQEMNTLEGQQEGYKRPRNEHIRGITRVVQASKK